MIITAQKMKHVLNLNSLDVKVERDVMSFCQRHTHRYVEFVCFYKGTGRHIVNEEEFTVKSGDVFVLNEGVYHQFSGEGLCAINIMIKGEYIYPMLRSENFISDFYAWAFPSEPNQFVNKEYVYVSDFFHSLNEGAILSLLQEFNIRNIGFELVLKNEICTLLVNIFRKILDDADKGKMDSMHKKMIEQVMTYIDENVKDIKKTKDVTDRIGYNPVYFSRVFNEYVGMTIPQYIRQKRIEYACRLLADTDYSVEKICEDIGYNDIKNFYKTFKLITSKTPKEYRNDLSKRNKKSLPLIEKRLL